MKNLFLIFVIFTVGFGAYASNGGADLPELESTLEKILEILTGNIVKIVLSISLAGIFIGMAMNRENGEMQKKLLVFAIAIGGLLGVSNLMDLMFDASGQVFLSQASVG